MKKGKNAINIFKICRLKQQSTTAPPTKHFAHTARYYKEGRRLEFKYLLNHKNPETYKFWRTAAANEYRRLMQVIGKSRNLKDCI